jgi:pathogenesis-related protein 1
MQLRSTLRLSFLAALAAAGCDSGSPPPTSGEDAGMTTMETDAFVTPGDDAFVATEPDAFNASAGETGRMVGMTEAHNRFRAMAVTDTPIPALVWDTDLAAVAQAYSEELANNGCGLMHSSNGYGENLYWQRGSSVTAGDVVASWHEEIECYTFGPFMRGDACNASCVAAMNSSGCGHYTQVVWRNTRRLGCGMATCSNGAEIWTCNYDPPGNYLGQEAY